MLADLLSLTNCENSAIYEHPFYLEFEILFYKKSIAYDAKE
ncbi:hypothetical protein BSI_33300 [Bacillus inaquosorum KCTC 13429]|uniref:Uncharacterized protein n=1 Tax=Bacillus inaquosorum KCTC 13429 TaxID=1236548 RepID=A0A9W5PC41_9BACI|nr:hypothetical protein BSI_33300 [Bacillus inaquosorum KCTC 13429]